MTPEPGGPSWGSDASTFDAYALAGARHVYRILLPAVHAATGREVPWRDVAVLSSKSARLDGATSWSELTELSGLGDDEPELAAYTTASGVLSDRARGQLLRLLSSCTDLEEEWVAAPPRYWAPGSTPLVKPGTGSARSRRPEEADLRDAYRRTGRLRELVEDWSRHGLPSRAASVSARLGIAAPAYSDSLVLSSVSERPDLAASSRLEVFRVDRFDPLPRMDC